MSGDRVLRGLLEGPVIQDVGRPPGEAARFASSWIWATEMASDGGQDRLVSSGEGGHASRLDVDHAEAVALHRQDVPIRVPNGSCVLMAWSCGNDGRGVAVALTGGTGASPGVAAGRAAGSSRRGDGV